MLTLENELCILEKYNLTPTELFAVKVILLAKEEEEYDYLNRYNSILNGEFRLVLERLQDKGIILKSYKIPKSGSPFIVDDVEFNKNFLKQYFRASFEMGEELFNIYPQSTIVNGLVYNLKRVSKHFDSLEEAFSKYAKYIKYNPDVHNEIIDLIDWGIQNGYNFTTLDSFIIDHGWLSIKALKENNGINVNTDAIKMI